jgi:maltodextrin utilization protein YvdJ
MGALSTPVEGIMDALSTIFDMAAHARGGGHYTSSCHYNCGWDMLTALSLFVLVPCLWILAKTSLTGIKSFKDVYLAAGVLAFCALVIVASIFLGPVIVILIMVVGGFIIISTLSSWEEEKKKRQEKGNG